MFDKRGLVGELIEKGQSSVRSSAKSTKKSIADFGEEAMGQITGSASTDQGTSEQGAQNQAQGNQMSDEEAQDFLQNLYGPKNSSKATALSSQSSVISHQTSDRKKPATIKQVLGIPGMKSEEDPVTEAKKAKIRQELHKTDYFDPTFNPPRGAKEERTQDKVEREEEKKKMEDLEEKKELKNVDLGPAVKQGTTEKAVGVSG